MTGSAPGPSPLADELDRFVVARLDAFTATFGSLLLPPTFAGHAVGDDARADVAATLAPLASVDSRWRSALIDALRSVRGATTHTFASYRVAEALRRFGPFDGNPLLDGWSHDERAEVAAACDATSAVELLDAGVLPPNYTVVLARCEVARHRLGLLARPGDGSLLADLLDRTAVLLGRNPAGFLDDSAHGAGRYDIYALDVWLFSEALLEVAGDDLTALWHRGMAQALDLAVAIGSPQGATVVWGRSTGVLSLALTVELAAIAVRTSHPAAPVLALRALGALTELSRWFDDTGVVTAHQHRSPYGYRGPARRLQLTFDILGKLTWAAETLRAHAATGLDVDSSAGTARPPSALVRFEPEGSGREPAVWIADRHGTPLLVPFVGATRSDYLPAPREPGLFEVPVDSSLVTWLPTFHVGGKRFTLGGVPDVVERWGTDGAAVRARWSALVEAGHLDPAPDAPSIAAAAELAWQRIGRRLSIEGSIELDEAASIPGGVSITVPESAHRPLGVRVATEGMELPSRTIATDGMKEWRSFWGELARVHEADLPLSRDLRFAVDVVPKLRISSSSFGHHYDRSLYDPIAFDVALRPSAVGVFKDRSVDLRHIDAFHLHWPEWMCFDDIDAHRTAIRTIDRFGVPIVWTVHNLVPHEKRPDVYEPIYQLWVDAAAAMIHHSTWARDQVGARYRVPATTPQHVIPHGHFGDLYGVDPGRTRADDEAALGLPVGTGRLRIGIVGAPRREKDVSGFLAAVAASTNDGIEVACWSLAPGDTVPDDPRIVLTAPYEMVDAAVYARRLHTCDVLAFPFGDGGEMLATGTASDAAGLGLPALVSSWGYLSEHLGDAALPMGDTIASMTAALDALDPAAVGAAAAASRELRGPYDWGHVAKETLAVFEAVVAGRSGTSP